MKNFKLFITAAVIFVLDRVSKFLILKSKILYYPILEKYLSISSVSNTGAAFSTFQGQQDLLILISSLAVLFFVWYFAKHPIPLLEQLGWGLLLGGALGNLFDRVVYNCVIDFINIECLQFPVFNVADMAITFGTILVCYYCFFIEGRKDA
jgi:signal peptidase II